MEPGERITSFAFISGTKNLSKTAKKNQENVGLILVVLEEIGFCHFGLVYVL